MIKIGILLSYDYEFLKNSLPCLYPQANTITLAMDKDFRTWSGNNFTIEPSFFEWLKWFDVDKKITIYKDDFYKPELLPIENETHERNMLAKYMGEGGWHIQIDADEYFINFPSFVRFLDTQRQYLQNYQKTPIAFIVNILVLYKKTKRGFLYIKNSYDSVHIATNNPHYKLARNGNHPFIHTNFFLFHQSWAREDQEMLFKMRNWGHSTDINIDSYFKLWQAIDEDNYNYLQNFHPMYGPLWKALEYVEGGSIAELIQSFPQQHILSLSKRELWMKNNPQLAKFYNRAINLKNKF
jgi:hypothetical protein